MDRKVVDAIIDIQDSIKEDPEYRALVLEYESLSDELLRQMETMDQRQRDAVTDYCGLLIELHLKILEYALLRREKTAAAV